MGLHLNAFLSYYYIASPLLLLPSLSLLLLPLLLLLSPSPFLLPYFQRIKQSTYSRSLKEVALRLSLSYLCCETRSQTCSPHLLTCVSKQKIALSLFPLSVLLHHLQHFLLLPAPLVVILSRIVFQRHDQLSPLRLSVLS